jgi:hypothetical protein
MRRTSWIKQHLVRAGAKYNYHAARGRSLRPGQEPYWPLRPARCNKPESGFRAHP